MPERARRLALALLLLLLGASAAAAQDSRPPLQPANGERPLLRIGTNLVAGLYYPAGGALCRAVARAAEMRCLVESTNGSTANIRGLLAGELEFGIVQSDWQYHAVQGTATFRDGGPVGALRSVMSLHAEPLTLVVREGAGIENFAQLKGKRLGAGPADSGQRILFEILAAGAGWRLQELTLDSAPPEQAVRAFCAGELDAILLMGNHPNAATQKLLGGCKGSLVPVAGPAVNKTIADRRYYAPAIIPAGLYGPEQPEIATLGVRATLVTVDKVPSELVYALVRAVGENFAEFAAQHPGLASLRREEIASYGLTAPLHEGALRYFREAGLVK
ncbi:MAG: TAXI family TRAP transporter solute-binding subunit [Reyranellaceae bacterium]